MQWWEVNRYTRGIQRSKRHIFEAVRMLGLWTVSCQRSKEQPSLKLEDLCVFPWERSGTHSTNIPLTEDDEKELQRLMREENEKIEQKIKEEQS